MPLSLHMKDKQPAGVSDAPELWPEGPAGCSSEEGAPGGGGGDAQKPQADVGSGDGSEREADADCDDSSSLSQDGVRTPLLSCNPITLT